MTALIWKDGILRAGPPGQPCFNDMADVEGAAWMEFLTDWGSLGRLGLPTGEFTKGLNLFGHNWGKFGSTVWSELDGFF